MAARWRRACIRSSRWRSSQPKAPVDGSQRGRNPVWDDVAFEAGTIRWRAERDKKGFEQVVPMSSTVQDALLAQQKAQAAIGMTWVFPSPKDPRKPCDRHLFDDWLRRAYRLASDAPDREPVETQGITHSTGRTSTTSSN